MERIFNKGGFNSDNPADQTDVCTEMNTASENWREVARMYQLKSACAFFQGRVYVSGGKNNQARALNTVEACDHVTDTWSHMPEMVYGRSYNNLIAVRNKLYAVGDSSGTFEAYDSICGRFSILKRPSVRQLN